MRDDILGDLVDVRFPPWVRCPCHRAACGISFERTLANHSSLTLQLEEPPIAYPDVPSFIAALQLRHDSILEDIDTSTSEGKSMQVGPFTCNSN